MERKALLRNNHFLAVAAFCVIIIGSCQNAQKKLETTDFKDFNIDISLIPNDTINSNDKKLSLVNGIYWYNNKKYAGIIIELYPNGNLKKQFSVYQGMLHGMYRSFYENKMPWEIRSYKNNLSTGKHFGYWPITGNPKFEYSYYEEKMEGLQKKWYPNGRPYLSLRYANDHEEGLQQGWRDNGKLFLNYEAKDGFRYGLQKATLCYTLKDEQVKLVVLQKSTVK
jgi:antitoxin component YwqK of YwqJK toxin-antitoxin module